MCVSRTRGIVPHPRQPRRNNRKKKTGSMLANPDSPPLWPGKIIDQLAEESWGGHIAAKLIHSKLRKKREPEA